MAVLVMAVAAMAVESAMVEMAEEATVGAVAMAEVVATEVGTAAMAEMAARIRPLREMRLSR